MYVWLSDFMAFYYIQARWEILKCKFGNSLKITTTALIFQSMFLVTNEIQENLKKKTLKRMLYAFDIWILPIQV